jgi:undecaprenyl-phosphate 4-deoxy-4-formamido-L-arabinose transferase
MMEEKVIAISVVIPLFNEEGNIVELYFRLTNVLSNLNKTWEIVFIDNGSTDKTLFLLKELKEKDERIKIIRLIKNFGKNAALMAGFIYTKGKIVITIAGDLSEKPEDIPKLLEVLGKGYDVVGSYQLRSKTIIRRFTEWFVYKFTGIKINDYRTILRVYRRGVIKMLSQCRERISSIPHLIYWLGVNTTEIKLEDNSRKRKERWDTIIKEGITLVLSFSPVLLRIVSSTGILTGVLGMVVGILFIVSGVIIDYGGLNIGLGIMLFLISIQLLLSALIGEYLSKMYIQVQGRPYYIIEEVIE